MSTQAAVPSVCVTSDRSFINDIRGFKQYLSMTMEEKSEIILKESVTGEYKFVDFGNSFARLPHYQDRSGNIIGNLQIPHNPSSQNDASMPEPAVEILHPQEYVIYRFTTDPYFKIILMIIIQMDQKQSCL